MLTPVPTVLNRAWRHKKMALCCVCHTSSILLACTEAAEKNSSPLIVGIPFHSKEREYLLASSFWLAHSSIKDFAVFLDLQEGDLEEALSFITQIKRYPTLALKLPKEWLGHIKPHFEGDIILHLCGLETVGSLESLLRDTPANALVFPMSPTSTAWSQNTHQLAILKKALSLPIIIQENVLTTSMAKGLIASGVSGLILENQLNEAFTAGLRTGLHSRSIVDPNVYLEKARLAVSNQVSTYQSLI